MIKQESNAGREWRQLRAQRQSANVVEPDVDDIASNSSHARHQQMRSAFLQELLQPPKTEFTTDETTFLDEQLPKYLAPEYTSTRPGPGRTTLTYVEAWRIKNVANRLFGFNGWSTTVSDITTDFTDVAPDGRVFVGVSAVVRVTLKDGTCHEDVGYGSSENQKSRAASFEKAKKEAVTDALKRALTSFGNVLGACLYDKNYCKEISQFKPLKRTIAESDYFHDSSPSLPRSGMNINHRSAKATAAVSTAFTPTPSTSAPLPRASTPSTATTASHVDSSMRPTPLSASALNPPANGGPSKSLIQQPANIAITSNNVLPPSTDPLPVTAHMRGQTSVQPVPVRQPSVNNFLPADPVEEDRIFQAESPRMSDLDIDMDLLLRDESPVMVKQETYVSSPTLRSRPQQNGYPRPRASSTSPRGLPSVVRQLSNHFQELDDNSNHDATSTTAGAGGPGTSISKSSSSTPTKRLFGRVSSSPSLSSPDQKQGTGAAEQFSKQQPPQKPQFLQFQPIRTDSSTTTINAKTAANTTNNTTTTTATETSSKEQGLSFQAARPRLTSPFVTGQPVPSSTAATTDPSKIVPSSSTTATTTSLPLRSYSVAAATGSDIGSKVTVSRPGSAQPSETLRMDSNDRNPFKVTSSNASSSGSDSQGSLSGGSSSGGNSTAATNLKFGQTFVGQKRPFGAAEATGTSLTNKEPRLN